MDVVALLLQMLALEVGQLVDLIDIVEAAAPGLETEDAGEPALQLRYGLLGDARQAEGNASLPGIVHQKPDGSLVVAVANGVDIGALAVPMGEENQAIFHNAYSGGPRDRCC